MYCDAGLSGPTEHKHSIDSVAFGIEYYLQHVVAISVIDG
jgi:hypothetical protein